MKCFKRITVFLLLFITVADVSAQQAWIRINQLGYTPEGIKVAVWCSKEPPSFNKWQVVDAKSKKVVFSAEAGKSLSAYGPFSETLRLHFTNVKKPGRYYLQAGAATSPEFEIGGNVYKGAADFCLYYMRQQRSKFNPIIKDSCHTQDGYTLYGPMPDSTFVDVSGGWHDATDYLQYVTTSANATYHLLAAYRDFPAVFGDQHQENGLEGSNQIPDVLDEARWGLDWLLKMHPRQDWMFNQVADDRDHIGLRMPGLDSQYNRGYQRPVYFVSGEPQIQGKSKNHSTGTSSTAGKFSSAFSLGSVVFDSIDTSYAGLLSRKSNSAFAFGLKKPGVMQTASVKSPYIYAEENWMDDMELAGAMLPVSANDLLSGYNGIDYAYNLAKQEPLTPWLGADTASHYQWYPFINVGHYELLNKLKDKRRDTIADFYKQGIELVSKKANQNAFLRGIPFIWCSNNLTTSFAIQCYWYRKATGDNQFEELEQANFDWLFGCNPWGTSMVYGLPAWGDTPTDPHASFLNVGQFPVNGGIVDGPVYGSIYSNLIGLTLTKPDVYDQFQSSLAVYHDDHGDYSTNEPTMDGTASLIYLLASKEDVARQQTDPKPDRFTYSHGAIIRGDSLQKKLAIVFTGDEFGEGGLFIAKTLAQQNTRASFFFTGNFYANRSFSKLIKRLKNDGQYLGSHSDKHLLYCDWTNRDSLLVTREEFNTDLVHSYAKMKAFGIAKKDAPYFLPPYEWYNDSIAAWTNQSSLQLVNFTPGTLSNADYTTPAMKNYRPSDTIFNSIINYEQSHINGLNGFILLLHIGTEASRTDKMYNRLPELLTYLKQKQYQLVTLKELLETN